MPTLQIEKWTHPQSQIRISTRQGLSHHQGSYSLPAKPQPPKPTHILPRVWGVYFLLYPPISSHGVFGESCFACGYSHCMHTCPDGQCEATTVLTGETHRGITFCWMPSALTQFTMAGKIRTETFLRWGQSWWAVCMCVHACTRVWVCVQESPVFPPRSTGV